jgi:hypothetical protein
LRFPFSGPDAPAFYKPDPMKPASERVFDNCLKRQRFRTRTNSAGTAHSEEGRVGALQDKQRPGTRERGGWPMALTRPSHPSSNPGWVTGARGADFGSAGPFTAFRLLADARGKRSPLSTRLKDGPAVMPGAAWVADISSATTNEARPNAAQAKAARNRE